MPLSRPFFASTAQRPLRESNCYGGLRRSFGGAADEELVGVAKPAVNGFAHVG